MLHHTCPALSRIRTLPVCSPVSDACRPPRLTVWSRKSIWRCWGSLPSRKVAASNCNLKIGRREGDSKWATGGVDGNPTPGEMAKTQTRQKVTGKTSVKVSQFPNELIRQFASPNVAAVGTGQTDT